MSKARGMVSTGQEGTHGPTGAMGGGVAIFIAAITSVILLPLIWAESFASLIGVGVVLLAILVLAVAFLRVAFVYPEPIRHAADVRAEAEPRSLPLASFERIFAVSVLFYSTGAFWRVLQGSRDMESGAWTGARSQASIAVGRTSAGENSAVRSGGKFDDFTKGSMRDGGMPSSTQTR